MQVSKHQLEQLKQDIGDGLSPPQGQGPASVRLSEDVRLLLGSICAQTGLRNQGRVVMEAVFRKYALTWLASFQEVSIPRQTTPINQPIKSTD